MARVDGPMVGVRGTCSACGSRALFLGAGGYVTCSWLECSDPSAPSKDLGVEFASSAAASPTEEDA